MENRMYKKILVLTISILTMLTMVAGFNTIAEEETEGTRTYTHTAFVEVSTATWCPSCPASNTAWHNYYESGNYDFEYTEMVADKVSVAYTYLQNHYNFKWYPTSFFDGGYEVVPGSSGLLSSLNSAGNRAVYDIEPEIVSCKWLGTANIEIDLEITNYESTTYDGDFRVYILEEESTLWNDNDGNPYYHAFLDFADDQAISISPGATYSKTINWDGSSSYPGLTYDNCQVIVAVFNDDPHQGYADPPSGNPFTAYYADDAVSAHPVLDSGPPEITNVYASPAISIVNEDVEIFADVSDDSGINEVKMVIEDPEGVISNDTMTLDTGDTYIGDLTSISPVGIYSYHIWTEDVNGNQNSSAENTFEVMDPHITDLLDNWNFISLTLNDSIDKTDIIVNYNSADHTWAQAVSDGMISDFIFGWDPIAQSYTFVDTLHPGKGYWVFAYHPCELKTPVMNAFYDNAMTDLEQNWNVVGSAYCDSILKDDILVHYNSADHTWAQAVSDGMISDFIFGWDRGTQSYTFASIVENGEAYWFFASQSCSLLRP